MTQRSSDRSLAGISPEALQHEVEQLLYREAALIDARRFDEWLTLFTDDAVYCVPNASQDGEIGQEGFIILEDRRGIEERTRRLQHPAALTQVPPPRTRHMITNVTFTDVEGDLLVASNQVIYFARQGRAVQYAGSWEHTLQRIDGAWRIKRKKVFLLSNDQAMSQIPVL